MSDCTISVVALGGFVSTELWKVVVVAERTKIRSARSFGAARAYVVLQFTLLCTDASHVEYET